MNSTPYAKKKFGQNFLKSSSALEKIVRVAGLSNTDTVLEIGPGRGALTKKLLESGAQVRALEIDPDMIEILEEKFEEEIRSRRLQIFEGDIEKISPHELIDAPYKLVANIPYYITGLIIKKFLESDHQPTSMTLLVQKEVAERIVDGSEGGKNRSKENILSLSVKVFGNVRYVATVPAAAFNPAPRVDSAIIHISDISQERLNNAGITVSDFFTLVKAGFAQKRKTLRNNLVQKGYEKHAIEQTLETMNIDIRIRAEDLTLDQWIELARTL